MRMSTDIEAVLSKIKRIMGGNYVQEEVRAVSVALLELMENNRELLEEVEGKLRKARSKEPDLLLVYDCLKEEERILKELYDRWRKYLLFLVSQGLIDQEVLRGS